MLFVTLWKGIAPNPGQLAETTSYNPCMSLMRPTMVFQVVRLCMRTRVSAVNNRLIPSAVLSLGA